MDFGVHASGFNTVNSPVFSSAWMVPCIPDESCASVLKFDTETLEFDFAFVGMEARKVRLTFSVLKVTDSLACKVKELDGSYFAVLNRGLL